MRQIHQVILNEVLRVSPLPGTLLDVGCGNGGFTAVLASALPAAAITATDPKEQKSFPSLPNVTVLRCGAESLPLQPESFDVAVAALSLHHWGDKAAGIKGVSRVLRTGGRFIIGDPLLEDWMKHRFWGRLMQTIDRGSFTDAERLTGSLEEAGFRYVRISMIPNSMKALYLTTAVKA